MNPTPEQLRLAADIIEKGLPFELKPCAEFDWRESFNSYETPDWLVANGFEIRLKTPSPQWVPLEAGDVPPLSVFRHNASEPAYWCMPSEVNEYGITFWSYKSDGQGEHLFRTWQEMRDYLILRPGTTEWQPCRKLKQP